MCHPSRALQLLRSGLLGAIGVLGAASAASAVQPGPAEANWTLMIYMAADNNLEQAALIDLDEIEAGLPESGVEILVLIDRAKGYSEDLGDWTGAKVLRMRPDRVRGEVHAETVLELGEINTGDPVNLQQFIRYSQTHYPARHYGLVLWDHGGGWQGMADDEEPGGDAEHDNLSLTEVSDALRATIDPRRPLDLIGFDMCLMAQLEVGYEVAPFARYMVASQAVEPGYGWPYDVLLPEFGRATVGPKRLAQNIVRNYAEFTDRKSERIATQSAFDLSRLEDVRISLDAVIDELAKVSGQRWPDLTRALFWGDSFESGGKAANLRQGEQALASSDLLDVLKRSRLALGKAFPAEAQFQRLVESIDAAVLDSHVSTRHRLSHGVSIYAPPAGNTFNDRYLDSRFAQASRWDDYLRLLHGTQQHNKQAPRITAMNFVRAGTNEVVDTGSMLDNTTLKLTVEGNHLLWISGMAGRYDAQNKGHVIYAEQYLFDSRFMAEKVSQSGAAADLLMPNFAGNRAELEMEVSSASFAVSNGAVAAFATLDITAAQLGQDNTAAIQALIKRDGLGEHRAIIDFDLLTWQASSVVLLMEQEDGRLVPRGFEPRADDQVTLLFKFMADGNDEFSLRRGETMPWNKGLELIMDEVPAGRYTSWAVAENLSGETHVAKTSITTTPPATAVQAGFAGAKALAMADLGGSWSSPAGETLFRIGKRLEPDSNLAELLIDPSELPAAARDYRFLVELDTRLLPTLHLLVLDQHSKLLGRDTFMLLANPNEPDRLWVKTLVGGEGRAVGEIVELVRTERLAGSGSGNGASSSGEQPGSGPSVVPGPSNQPVLAGIWQGQGADGYVWLQLRKDGTFQQVKTAFDQSGKAESWGRFSYSDGVMQVQFDGGQMCNAWGCQPWYPDPMAPFPLQINATLLQTPWISLYRQQ